MKRIFIGIGIVTGLFLIALITFRIIMAPQIAEQKQVRAMEIEDIDLSLVKDGTYQGDFTYEVDVFVKDHLIEEIRILKNRDANHPKKAEGVIENVLEAQSLNVDVVSGASTTSKAFLKAIERALKKGMSQASQLSTSNVS